MTAHPRRIAALTETAFHVPRTLLRGQERLSEEALLRTPGVTILLAEPGAGKSAVLRHAARRIGARPIRASLLDGEDRCDALVVDAFDEVSRLGAAGLTSVLKDVRRTGAQRVLLASRSGEWEASQTALVRDLFGEEPSELRLAPLDEAGQAAIVAHHHPEAAFNAFAEAVRRFDLEPLLGNPQFLLLLAAAYVESGGAFTTRRAIFEDAQRHLAREANDAVPQKGAPTADQRTAWANEIFAVLLLSGSDGVSVADGASARTYPRIGDLGIDDDRHGSVLDTRLFRLAGQVGRHEPVHRIVAEYGAARHLVARLAEPGSGLTVRQLLAVVAPNGVARDELRGLMGWMAALGPQHLQKALIDLDPYAVLANGDPAQLTDPSKCRLLDRLEAVAERDPYFQRADIWRSFGAAEFFTPATVGTVRRLLDRPDPEDGHLQGLLLSLLHGSPIVPVIKDDLHRIVLDPEQPRHRRWRALQAIRYLPDLDAEGLFDQLLDAGGATAVRLAADIVITADPPWDCAGLLRLLTDAQDLYAADGRDALRSRDYESRAEIRELVGRLDLASVEWLLDRITPTLTCSCPIKKACECDCRTGASKVAGLLLDCWFEVASAKEPVRLWRWMRGMRFRGHAGPRDTASVKALCADHDLRSAIQVHTLIGLTDDEAICDMICEHFNNLHGHAGLSFGVDDRSRLAEAAFGAGNVTLWKHCMPFPRRFVWDDSMKGSDPQRRLMRDHARRDPRFLRAWYQRDRNQRRIVFEQRHRRYRFHRRWARREWEQKRGYWEALQRDREVIMKGAHVWWLHRIASAYLIEPDKLEEEFGGYIDVPAALRAALRNLPVDPPTVDALARREGSGLARLLHGACLAELRAVGTLDAVSTAILVAVKTDLGGYNGVSKEEAEALERAVNARLFAEDGSAERFLRAYAEPSLASGESAVGLHWLGHDDPFKALRGSLSLEWLRRFPDLEHHARGQLFDLAAQHGDRTALIELIDQRCADLLAGTLPHPREAQRDFWFLRHAFFSADRNEGVWDALTRDPNGVFLFNSRQDLTQRHAAPGWPDLSARKVERILDAFIGAWPKVYLPSSYGTDSPEGETAYRFLTDVVWAIGRDAPEEAVGVIDRLRADSRFGDFNPNLRSLRASVIRQQALEGFEPPEPGAVVEMLGRGHPATVGQLRALFVELLSDFQSHIDGAELDTRGIFYDGDAPVRETVAAKRIVEWLRPRLEAAGVFDVLEHHLKDDNRCDITAGLVASERRHLLVCEVKGQWHRELFTAAQAQLEEKYTIHPNADGQGVYLILWFGEERVVAGRRTHPYRGPEELRDSIVSELDDNQRARMDVVVLDVS